MTDQQQLEIQKWDNFISQNVRGKVTRLAISEYVNKLILNNTVVILNFTHLAVLLGVEQKTLARVLASPESFYYDFKIPKRKGGFRNISAPYPVLLSSQKWVYENILSNQPVHESAKAFIKKVSIVDNAKVHLNQKCLLQLDIEDFFPSIGINRVISIFRRLGYTKKISYYLASLCCVNGVLPQGAATSPCISNLITKRLDFRLSGFANKFNLKYSRYADDFSFSGDEIPVKMIEYIKNIINDEGFRVNQSKTKLISDKGQKIITGISISSGKLTIPKSAKREVRKNVHYVLKKGLFDHQKHIESYDPIYVERLLGYLFFWLSVEPENGFVRKSVQNVKEYLLGLNVEYSAYKIQVEY